MIFYDYLETSGTQFINTGVKIKSTTKIEIKCQYFNQVKEYSCLFGGRQRGAFTTGSNDAWAVGDGNVFGCQMGAVYQGYGSVLDYNTDIVFTGYSGLAGAWLNKSYNINSSLSTGIADLYLMSCNDLTYGRANEFAWCGRIYYCKIYDGDALVNYFVPAADGDNIGLYDKVTGIMHTNAGTGSFTVGPALNAYTVSFNANGGTGTMPDQSIEIDTPTPLSTNQFTKDRSVFVGWSESASGPVQYANGQSVTNLAEVGQTITLYAIWEQAPLSINLQSNASEKNKVDKDITNILTLSGTLRQETSVLDPVILIEGSEETILTANYLTIPDFGRSYFITGFRSIRKGLIEISCHVDVLYSYKDTLRQQKAIIKRNTSNWNLYLNDGSLTTYQDPYVLTEPFPAGFTGQTFVLAVAGS